MKVYKLVLITVTLILSINANAALHQRLGGAAYYDDVSNLTWLADANYAQTSGYDTDGRMTWTNATAWVSTLNINDVTGWRLPIIVLSDPTCDTEGTVWYYCTGSEMGDLYYNVLADDSYFRPELETEHNDNYYLFSNIQFDNLYMSSTIGPFG